MGTSLPTTGQNLIYSRNYVLKKGNNPKQIIKVFEGTSKKTKDNYCLGEFEVNLDEEQKNFTINMRLDNNSILHVYAVVNGKKSEDIEMKPIND